MGITLLDPVRLVSPNRSASSQSDGSGGDMGGAGDPTKVGLGEEGTIKVPEWRA